MIAAEDRKTFWLVLAVMLFLITLPFWSAALQGGENYTFGGFLLNPLDGNTYYAKMQQGWQGAWRFKLPFTAEPGEGAYLFPYYLLLGHLSRIFRLSIPLTFSIARVFGSLVMLLALYRFVRFSVEEPRPRQVAFVLAALGSGLGWMLVPFGVFTSDFWVAESFPFLSAYDNAHFPLGLALILWLLAPNPAGLPPPLRRLWSGIGCFAVTFVLALVAPFGVVIALVSMSGVALWRAWDLYRLEGWSANILRGESIRSLVWISLGGLPVLLYEWVAIHGDPVLSGWNAQNLTPSPPLGDLIVSLSPALLLTVWGAAVVIKSRLVSSRVLLIWAVSGLALIMVPIGLQRRFMMGLYIPLAGLAGLGIERLSHGRRRIARWLILILFILALPTNFLVIWAGQAGAANHDPSLFFTRGESAAFSWIENNTPPDALILAGPDSGLLIPAHTGRRVIYGHPFETVDASAQQKLVTSFYQDLNGDQALDGATWAGVDYIFYGPREQELGKMPLLSGVHQVYAANGVQIFALDK